MNKITFFVLGIVMLSCQKPAGVTEMRNLNNRWNKNDVQKFELNISDAQTPKNIIFVVRNNNQYPYSNLFVMASFAKKGASKKTTDTLNYVLARPDGKFLGTGLGHTKEIMFQLKNDYRFPENGTYLIEIQHGMRTENLQGIEDIGIKIENR